MFKEFSLVYCRKFLTQLEIVWLPWAVTISVKMLVLKSICFFNEVILGHKESCLCTLNFPCVINFLRRISASFIFSFHWRPPWVEFLRILINLLLGSQIILFLNFFNACFLFLCYISFGKRFSLLFYPFSSA